MIKQLLPAYQQMVVAIPAIADASVLDCRKKTGNFVACRRDIKRRTSENVTNNSWLFLSKTTIARAFPTLFCTFLCGHFPTTT